MVALKDEMILRSIKLAQTTLGVAPDGVWGPTTQAAYEKAARAIRAQVDIIRHLGIPGFDLEDVISFRRSRTPAAESAAFVTRALREASKLFADLPFDFVYRVAFVESSLDPKAFSSAKAKGVMQLLPGAVLQLKETYGYVPGDLFDPEENIAAGCLYLTWVMRSLGLKPTSFENQVRIYMGYNLGVGGSSKLLAGVRTRALMRNVEAQGFSSFEEYQAGIRAKLRQVKVP